MGDQAEGSVDLATDPKEWDSDVKGLGSAYALVSSCIHPAGTALPGATRE